MLRTRHLSFQIRIEALNSRMACTLTATGDVEPEPALRDALVEALFKATD